MSEPNVTGAPNERPTRPQLGCCGGDFAPFWPEGVAPFSPPGRFMTEAVPHGGSPASCPMARMCQGWMKGGTRRIGLLLLIPAAMLLLVGAAILLVPGVLTWLVAGGLIVAGCLILAGAFAVRRRPAPTA